MRYGSLSRPLAAALVMSSLVLTACSEEEEVAPLPENPVQEWDLTDLYATPQAWESEYQTVASLVASLPRFQGSLGTNAASLLDALKASTEAEKRAVQLLVYSTLKQDEDLRVDDNRARNDRSQALLVKLGEATAWMAPEIIRVGEAQINAFRAELPELEDIYGHQLDDILRAAPHTLSDESEAVLAAASDVARQAGKVYDVFADAELPFPTVTLSDKSEITLDQSGYSRARQLPDRADRKLVFDTYWGKWKEFEGTLGANLSAHVAGHVFFAKARKYPNALSAALFDDAMPEAVYRTLIAEANTGLPTLHRYFKLRKQMLGITDDLAYYDIYPPMVSLEKSFPLAQSMKITLEALKPLGGEYTGILSDGFRGAWMHAYPQEGKASGAYMFGAAYDVHPYVLLNHHDDYDSLSTFAHEWGHAVHTQLTRKAQPYAKSDYPTFVAETASIMNEMLLQDYMVQQAETKEEKLFYLGEALEQMRGTFFRQTMFAEFELAIHEAAEKGDPLTGGRLTEIYCDLLKRYHGVEQGVMVINPAYCIEWAFIPHFYRNFYVYTYATSITGAAYLANQIETGGEEARETFLSMLRAGGSDYGYNIFKKAGLDMASPEPYRALIARMNSIMDEMESLLGQPAGETATPPAAETPESGG
ncbi:MAG: oligoendopeptidase F [Alphaproteobacteria bacterium]|nr:oligoendopeptidase F [Alphaproteobacteria bacterium]